MAKSMVLQVFQTHFLTILNSVDKPVHRKHTRVQTNSTVFSSRVFHRSKTLLGPGKWTIRWSIDVHTANTPTRHSCTPVSDITYWPCHGAADVMGVPHTLALHTFRSYMHTWSTNMSNMRAADAHTLFVHAGYTSHTSHVCATPSVEYKRALIRTHESTSPTKPNHVRTRFPYQQ